MITRLKNIFSFPVLTKELTELAAAKQTYVIRLVYAILFFLIGGTLVYDRYRRYAHDIFQALGRGRYMFEDLTALQHFAIYTFVPLLTASAITIEKERQSLQLLILTGMSPWKMIFEKAMGRIIVFLSLLLLILPLFAISYQLGGITSNQIVTSSYILILTTLQVAAISIMVSAWAYSSVVSFIGSYVMTGLITFLPVIVIFIIGFIPSALDNFRRDPFFYILREEDILLGLFPYYWFDVSAIRRQASLPTIMLQTSGIAVSTLLAFTAARYLLIWRAFGKPKQILKRIFGWFDQVMSNANRYTGGVTLAKGDSLKLLESQPVLWREFHSRLLAKPQHAFRLLLIILVPVVLYTAIAWYAIYDNWTDTFRDWHEVTVVMIIMYFPFAGLITAIISSGSFAKERSQQTLEVLLTTPISTRQIVNEKAHVAWRVIHLLSIPYLLLVSLSFVFKWYDTNSYFEHNLFLYLPISIGVYFSVMYIVGWVGIFFSLKLKTMLRSLIATIVTIVMWCGGSVFIIILIFELSSIRPRHAEAVILSFSPTFVFVSNEVGEMTRLWGQGYPHFFATAIVIAIVYYLIRRFSLTRADKYLGRVTS